MKDKVRINESAPTPDRLIGWLVSYGLDDMGMAYEIRAGRSFVSAHANGEGRSLSIDDETISSPHLVLKASNKHRVMVQDVFSDHGSYIMRGDAEKEQPISGPTEIRHGDWLRIGRNTRFQVCLIDGQAR